ncbi:MAG: EAL domain-containing protein [Gammaproteobacteria bacterium]|nr:EAL domain-containing protein [Gammaproteobacteria bacterium]
MTVPLVNSHTTFDSTSVILVLDDELHTLKAWYRQLYHEHQIFTATTVEQALLFLDEQTVDTVVINQRMPGVTDVEFLNAVRQRVANTVRILCVNDSDLDTAIREAHFRAENQWVLSELNEAKRQLEKQVSQQAQMLREREENFQSVVRKSRVGILLLDRNGVILFANPAASTQLGRDNPTLLGSQFGIPALSDKAEITILRPDQAQGIAEVTVDETQWQGQEAYLLMLNDVTRHKEAEAQANHLANHDHLTTLPNRALFTDRINQALLRAQRNKTKMAVLFMDLNRFKEVNDTLGHRVGDHLLQQFASRLAKAVRKSDTVARLGGDEFTVLLEGLNHREQAGVFAKKLQKLFRQPFTIENRELFATPSIGISIYPDDTENVDGLLRCADSAMYYAKNNKGIDYFFHSEELDKNALNHLNLENDLRRALERQEFVLYYQVQVRLRDRRPIGIEALVRWQHPNRGLVPANDFIPLLEETGLIVPVSDWILAETCRQIVEWRAMGVELLPVAVNISPKQLVDKDFVGMLKDLLDYSNTQPHLLRLELTENAVMQDQFRAEQTLNALRELGIELHMDDFGVGYSSLGLLKQLPFDVVKMDRSFIIDVLTDSSSALLSQAIINMAHGLKKPVTAEGVETAEQVVYLLDIGCDYAQGWYFGQPISAASMADDLQKWTKHLSSPAPGESG